MDDRLIHSSDDRNGSQKQQGTELNDSQIWKHLVLEEEKLKLPVLALDNLLGWQK